MTYKEAKEMLEVYLDDDRWYKTKAPYDQAVLKLLDILEEATGVNAAKLLTLGYKKATKKFYLLACQKMFKNEAKP